MTTIPFSLDAVLNGQLQFLNQYYDVTAIADENDTEAWDKIIRRENVKIKKIPMKRDISVFSDAKSLYMLYKFFASEKPYIVHTNTPKASLLGISAAFMAGIPHRIYTVTGLRYEGEKGLKRRLLIAMEKITCILASKVIPEGNGVKQTMIRHRITRKPLEVLGNGNINGIDPDYYNPQQINEHEKTLLMQQLSIKEKDFVFIYVGRLVSQKGISEIIKAFTNIGKNNKHVKLLLVGPFEDKLDPLDKLTMQKIQENPNIILTGFRSDIRPYLSVSDVFLLPSHREGFPNVILQAGAMGLPAIVSDINGCNEIITDRENGFIIPPGDAELLKEKMQLYITERNVLQMHKSVARDMIISRFSRQSVWNCILDTYSKL